MKSYIKYLIIVIAGVGFGSRDLQAQAFCALRDPVQTIKSLAPDANGQKSITETVDAAARDKIGNRLPFTLHYNELGKHTLYVLYKDGKPEGMIHSRSEKGKWGLIEIAWYFDMNLNVRGFKFQRCRDRYKDEIESERFAGQLRGKGFKELRALLDGSGKPAFKGALSVSKKAEPLAATCLRSALKTIAVTEIVWADHLSEIRQVSSRILQDEKTSKQMVAISTTPQTHGG